MRLKRLAPAALAAPAVLAAALAAPPAVAHPHAWIDLTVEVAFDAEGRVAALTETWLFDEFYTVFVIQGADRDGDGTPDQDALDAVMNENMKNLAEYDYFTEVRSGDAEIATGEARATSTRMTDGRLELKFTVPLSDPVSVADMPFRYAVFDPTYYIEMVHAEVDRPVTLAGAPAGCTAAVIQPDPDPEQVVLAASLDRTESAGDTLGKFFAETVRVTCAE